MTHYTEFVKLHMSKLDKTIPAKERFKMIAKMWQASKEAQPVKDVKAVRAIRAVKEAKGGDFMDMFPVLKMMGAGLKEVKAKPAKRSVKAVKDAKGGDFMDMFPVLKMMGAGLKEVKAKRSVKAVKGGSLHDIHDLSDDDEEAQPPSVNVINKLKSNVIKRGGFQGFQGHYPDAINESVMQQLVKKR